MAKTKNGAGEGVAEARQVTPVNLEEQMKAIEGQIAELRGIHNYLGSLKQGGFELIPPKDAKQEATG